MRINLKFSFKGVADYGTLPTKKNGIFWEFFPSVGPPSPSPPFGNPCFQKKKYQK